jgi:hypothetical protein
MRTARLLLYARHHDKAKKYELVKEDDVASRRNTVMVFNEAG